MEPGIDDHSRTSAHRTQSTINSIETVEPISDRLATGATVLAWIESLERPTDILDRTPNRDEAAAFAAVCGDLDVRREAFATYVGKVVSSRRVSMGAVGNVHADMMVSGVTQAIEAGLRIILTLDEAASRGAMHAPLTDTELWCLTAALCPMRPEVWVIVLKRLVDHDGEDDIAVNLEARRVRLEMLSRIARAWVGWMTGIGPAQAWRRKVVGPAAARGWRPGDAESREASPEFTDALVRVWAFTAHKSAPTTFKKFVMVGFEALTNAGYAGVFPVVISGVVQGGVAR